MSKGNLLNRRMEDLIDKLEKGEFPNIAQEKLNVGLPVIYCDDNFPGKIIREYPDGRKEFVDLDEEGKTVAVGSPG